MNKKAEKLLCVCAFAATLLISACGETQPQYAGDAIELTTHADYHDAPFSDLAHIDRHAVFGVKEIPEGIIAAPHVDKLRDVPLSLPVDLSHLPRLMPGLSVIDIYWRNFEGAWIATHEEYEGGPVTTISGCSPEGIWRYEYDYVRNCGSYPLGIPGWEHEHRFCYFRLPRDENGKISSGDVECRGEVVTFTEGQGNIHCGLPDERSFINITLHFDRRMLAVGGLRLEHAPQNFICDWNPSPETEPACLWHQDCQEGKFCSWEKGCWEGCKTAGCENEGDLCIGHMNDCRACPLNCDGNHTCTFWNKNGKDAPFFENISCSGPCEPACDSSSWCDELASECIECPGAPCPEGSMCAPLINPDTVICQSYCEVEGCPEDGIWCYHTSGNSCTLMAKEFVPMDNCDPACPEGYTCMGGGNEGEKGMCLNYCDMEDCPQNGYLLCAFLNNQCMPLMPELNL